MRVAALFVEKDGPYAEIPGVKLWPEERDARLYAGPYPVVAHPPCNRWCMPYAKMNETRYGHRVGDDGGCFKAALEAVRKYGGVLEHPANTAAWRAFGLPKPLFGVWQRTFCGGWVADVEQGAYGHPARKRTWLYAVCPGPPPLANEAVTASAVIGRGNTGRPEARLRGKRMVTGREASATPPAFRDLLIDLARWAR